MSDLTEKLFITDEDRHMARVQRAKLYARCRGRIRYTSERQASVNLRPAGEVWLCEECEGYHNGIAGKPRL